MSSDLSPDGFSVELARKKLAEIASTRSPLLAIDLDDVLCQTSERAAAWHNERFGTDMTTSSFYYAMWYKNPGWGTVPETLDKVKEFYDQDELQHADSVPGAAEGLEELQRLGYHLVIVTARVLDKEMDSTVQWLQHHFDGTFDYIIFSSQPEESIEKNGRCIGTTLSKLEICTELGALLLVDDLVETALAFGRHAQRPVLLFGDYEWNKRINTSDQWCFHEKLKEEDGREWWKNEDVELHPEDQIWRVRDWPEVVKWISQRTKHGSESSKLIPSSSLPQSS
ncbi:hypothetical protein DENSPDRAFT_837026 [Dentipellis sp. KUC8613]|nr:hypothetical protein DENSPDRAFT_837026 [Dentipellis sp. KUC8613]